MNAYMGTIKAADCGAHPGQDCAFTAMGEYTDRSGMLGTVQVHRCQHCGHSISWPPLADVAFLYEGRESQDFQPDTSGLARLIKTLAFTRQARALLRHARFAGGDILDFGCGSGLFTRQLGDLVPNGSVTGADFDKAPPAELADRVYLPQADLAARRGTFAMVIAMHVLEHDDNPGVLLDRIADMLAPGGTLVVEVPHVDCIWSRIFGRHWDAWYLPYHRVHFSRQSLRTLVQSRNLTIVDEIDVSVPTMGRTLANLCNTRNSLPFLIAGILLQPLQWLGERLSGQASALRIVAKRP